MFGIRLMFLLAVMGGLIAYIADKLGSKIGKKKLSVFGLRPHDTSVLLTVLSGVLISLFSVGILAISSESARTALFGMEKLQKELFRLTSEKNAADAVCSLSAMAAANAESADKHSYLFSASAKRQRAQKSRTENPTLSCEGNVCEHTVGELHRSERILVAVFFPEAADYHRGVHIVIRNADTSAEA